MSTPTPTPTGPKIFLLGATGYIGGELLIHLLSLRPQPQLTLLLRTESQTATFKTAFADPSSPYYISSNSTASTTSSISTSTSASTLPPVPANVHFVLGSLDSTDLLREQASTADITINSADCDHLSGAQALLAGVIQATKTLTSSSANPTNKPPSSSTSTSPSPSPRPKPILIQISGSGSLIDPTYSSGTLDPKIYSDTSSSISSIFSLPSSRPHVPIDRAILFGAEENNAHAVVLAPGQVFGLSRSLFKPESFGHEVYKAFVARGSVAVLEEGGGESRWGWVSVRDVAGAIGFVVGKGVEVQRGGDGKGNGSLQFGKQGYYFIGTGEVEFRERAEALAERLVKEGKIAESKKEVERVEGLEEVKAVDREKDWIVGAIMGTNSRFGADKLRELGWVPREKEWKPLMEEGRGERL